MSQPRTYQTEAVIIRKVKLGEADRILTLYTPHLGKISGVAKGIRRPKAKLVGHLELLTYSQVSLARGKNIDTIIGSQTIESFLPIKNDLWLTSCALYVAEMVDQFAAEHQENYPLFRLLIDTLERLAQGDGELSLRYFELHLLENSGYRPQLRQCVVCKSPLQAVVNAFSASAGGVLCPDCRQPLSYPLSVNAFKVMRFLQGNRYEEARRLKLTAGLSREVEGILREYIRYLLEREVKSAVWRDTLRRQLAGTSPH
jgi:DNA repair protein RecO (recombination protein O)